MAQYKVPQDVEADDKLLGPFSFRQFVYLLIAGGLIALAVGLFQIFPLLAILPVPVILFFGALALPLKKDQPMETYLAALISYYLKPHNRIWTAGQRESTIKITAPKIVEENRVRDITGEEATHRLSFLADIVDSEGRAIKGGAGSAIKEDLVAEANATNDMFETGHFDSLENTIAKDENNRHAKVLAEMREAIEKNENLRFENAALASVGTRFEAPAQPEAAKAADTTKPMFDVSKSVFDSDAVVLPTLPSEQKANENMAKKPESSIIDLANNSDFSVATIAKEAKRVKERNKGEVFISLR